MEMPSSSSSDPQTHNPPPLPNQSSSSSTKPLIVTSPPPPAPPPPPPPPPLSVSSSVPPPVYITQSLPVMVSKSPNPSKIQDPPPSGGVQQPQGMLYPVASSGRGFMSKNIRPPPPLPQPQSTDQLVTVANPGGGFQSRPILTFPNQVRAFGYSPIDPHQVHMMRPPALHPSQLGSRPISTAARIPHPATHPKVAPFPSSSPDFNGFKDLRDRNRDDTVATIYGRKVRLSDGASLYALCRSWVRNGLPQESQPQIGEGIKLLPRPLPNAPGDTDMPKRNESGDGDDEKEEDGGSVEQLSARDLLQRHVKRAKKVRARLREERLQRIERYKQRLTLLLPSPVEQFRNDAGPGG